MGLCSPKFNQCVDELLQHVQNYASDEVNSGVSLSIEQDLFVQSRGSLEEKSFSQPDTELTETSCKNFQLRILYHTLKFPSDLYTLKPEQFHKSLPPAARD